MCKYGNYQNVRVKIPADLSSTGEEKWKDVPIDSCIADIVDAIQKAGIDMRGSCCGHNRTEGAIHLQDGRVLLITDVSYLENQIRWTLSLLAKKIENQKKVHNRETKDLMDHMERITGKTNNPFPYTEEEMEKIEEGE